MGLVDKMLIARVATLLDELEVLSAEAVKELDRKQTSLAVSDLTKANEIPIDIISKIGIIQMQLTILKGLIPDEDK